MADTLDTLKTYLWGIWNSWTCWFNTAGIILLSVSLADPLLNKWLIENNFMWVVIVGNIVLRFKTDEGIKQKGKRGFWGG